MDVPQVSGNPRETGLVCLLAQRKRPSLMTIHAVLGSHSMPKKPRDSSWGCTTGEKQEVGEEEKRNFNPDGKGGFAGHSLPCHLTCGKGIRDTHPQTSQQPTGPRESRLPFLRTTPGRARLRRRQHAG